MWPFDAERARAASQRVASLRHKATREQGYTRWTLPNLPHEDAPKALSRKSLTRGERMPSFGTSRSSQPHRVLRHDQRFEPNTPKKSSPLVFRTFTQGSELWDFRLSILIIGSPSTLRNRKVALARNAAGQRGPADLCCGRTGKKAGAMAGSSCTSSEGVELSRRHGKLLSQGDFRCHGFRYPPGECFGVLPA